MPFTVTVCAASAVVPSVSMPEPSDASATVAVPDCTPAVPLFRSTVRLELLERPAPKPVNEPLALAAPVVPPMLPSRFSVKPSAVPRLLMLSAWLSVSPTWRSSKFTGFGAAALAVA